jgi:hypothetical protein
MDFDEEWINNFKVSAKRHIKIFYCYVDKENTLHKINQDIIEVKNNIIKRDELVRLIVSNKRKHQLLNILSYNIGELAEEADLKDFMTSINIEDIVFQQTPEALECTNSLFLIFKEYTKKLKSNGTRKVLISPSRNTRRKRLKANTPEL